MAVFGKVLTGTLAAGCAMALGLSALAAPRLAPHRAAYEIDLATVRHDSDITTLTGRMILEWSDACDGWTVNQKVKMHFTNRDGPEIDNSFSFSSFESKNGDNFHFTMRSLANGDPFEEWVGVANREAVGGMVRFSMPEGESLPLPVGTLFPTEHLFVLVEAALAGETWVGRTVFSGTGPDSLHEVTAFIGDEILPGSKPVEMVGEGDEAILALTGLRSWPVAMAYFPHAEQDGEPEFEVSYRLLENGVAGNLLLDYGDFAMRAVLARLELLPPPRC